MIRVGHFRPRDERVCRILCAFDTGRRVDCDQEPRPVAAAKRYWLYDGLMAVPQQEPEYWRNVRLELRTEGGWAIRLRGFGPAGILTMAAIPFAGTALIGAILV